MPITETVLIKASGSSLVRTLGFPLKESFNVTDVSTLRLKQGATILAATFTVGSRWKGVPSDATKPIKWARVTFKDTGTPRDLTVDDAGGGVPAQTNPLVVANNANDIVISNGVISATFNKVTDGQDLLTSVQFGASEILHATNKPRLTVPVDKKTRTTYTSSQYDFAAVPTDATLKVQNASLFTPGETVKFTWQGVVQTYFPTGGAGGTPFLIMATPFGLPDMTIALMTNTHRINLILDYGAGNHVVPLNYSDSQGFCLLSAPPVTPTPGMLVRIQEVENEPTRTIQSINAGANTITFTAALSNYIPQGVFLEPTTPASSTATMSLKASGTTIEKQYGDKAIIIKQEGVLKDGGQQLEANLTFVLRHWLYADTGFVRTKITLRNSAETISTNPCPSIFFKALNFDVPTALAATSVSDAVTDMATSVARYKADNLHSSLNHSAIPNFQWAVHEFNVQWPNAISVNATGCHFEVFPQSAGPIEFEGGITKSRDLFWGLNASNGLTLLDTIGATFDPAYIASSKAVRPNMVEKRNWNTVFASEPQKFRDACTHYERMMACSYDISVCEQVTPSRPAQTLKEYRWRLQEAGSGTYPFGWNKFGNTPDDVGFGNNRYDTPYILFREGLRESIGATQTALATYIGKVARFLQKGDQAAVNATANAPMLAGGTAHPNDPTKYNPLSSVAFTYQRSFADTLAVSISASDTNLQLNDASTFNLNLNSKVGVLMGSLSDPSTWEYFTYTGVSGNTLTGVVRNYKATGAKSFPVGTVVYPSGMNATQNDVIVATLIMGARVTNDPTLQDFAQRMWEDNCLYRDRIDGGNLDFVTVGNYQPVNL